MEEFNLFNLDTAEITTVKKSRHVPSKVQADTLFTFMTKVDYLIDCLKKSMVSPRYCDENISYLKISQLKRIAFPMKCFCDINMHRLEDHLSWYGYYGIAFSKEWGMQNKIQPVQYLNPASNLCKDFASSFGKAMKIDPAKQTSAEKALKDYLLHQLMFYKPYSGKFTNRNTGASKSKCFADECEWRYVPNVANLDYQQMYLDKNIPNHATLNDISNSFSFSPGVSLKYDYRDIKYIIVKTMDDFSKLMSTIESWNLESPLEHELISKILVWDSSKGDF